MSRGGARLGAGRKPGQVASHRKLANEVTTRAVGEGMTPLSFMLDIMRDVTEDKARRLDAAKAAAPFVHPKLANIEHSGDKDKPVVMEHIGLEANAFTSRITRLNAGASEAEGAGEPN